jgi:hypothetical protein
VEPIYVVVFIAALVALSRSVIRARRENAERVRIEALVSKIRDLGPDDEICGAYMRMPARDFLLSVSEYFANHFDCDEHLNSDGTVGAWNNDDLRGGLLHFKLDGGYLYAHGLKGGILKPQLDGILAPSKSIFTEDRFVPYDSIRIDVQNTSKSNLNRIVTAICDNMLPFQS